MSVSSVWFDDFLKKLPSLKGKRIAITGTTSGTGWCAAKTCIKLGAEVFILNRDSGRAKIALQEMQAVSPEAKVHHIPCDLMDFSNVRAAAKMLGKLVIDEGLDVLCCNAGIMYYPDEATVDGHDIQMQVNHLSHFLLVKELMPCLQVAAKLRGEARVVTMSSVARRGPALQAKFLSAKMGGKMGGSERDRYVQSKQANVLFTFELHNRLKAAGHGNIKALVCTPGFCDTNLFSRGMLRLACCVKKCLFQSQEDGTMGLLKCMAEEGIESGQLFVPEQTGERKGPPVALQRPLKDVDAVMEDPALFKMVWEESEKATDMFQI